jgi:hypothetical protein
MRLARLSAAAQQLQLQQATAEAAAAGVPAPTLMSLPLLPGAMQHDPCDDRSAQQLARDERVLELERANARLAYELGVAQARAQALEAQASVTTDAC